MIFNSYSLKMILFFSMDIFVNHNYQLWCDDNALKDAEDYLSVKHVTCIMNYNMNVTYIKRKSLWTSITILVLINVRKSGLGLFIFFVKEMCVLISWLI